MRGKARAIAGGLAASVLAISPAEAACPAPTLRDGLYAVEMRLELPNVATPATKTVELCLADDGRGDAGLGVLSDNNPLGRCPVSGIVREGDALRFEVRCPGPNKAWAEAAFVLREDGFEGRIAMNMGGKNMTLSEVQSGRRVAACPAGRAPRPVTAAAPADCGAGGSKP